jgi:hypothetical protein
VRVRAVAFADGGGDAALRPCARGPLAERRGGEDGDRPGAELERSEQAGQPAADDDDVVELRISEVADMALDLLSSAAAERERYSNCRLR